MLYCVDLGQAGTDCVAVHNSSNTSSLQCQTKYLILQITTTTKQFVLHAPTRAITRSAFIDRVSKESINRHVPSCAILLHYVILLYITLLYTIPTIHNPCHTQSLPYLILRYNTQLNIPLCVILRYTMILHSTLLLYNITFSIIMQHIILLYASDYYTEAYYYYTSRYYTSTVILLLI